jgi:hypothetical protein
LYTRRTTTTFRFTETIHIAAPTARAWNVLVQIESWWPPSNPEHISIDVQSHGEGPRLGTPIVFEERVAGIGCRADGAISAWDAGREATWEGEAIYKYYGIPIRVAEGVTWSLTGDARETELAATVWAEFPAGPWGRFLEWYTTKVLSVIDRDRAHARRELEYLRDRIEAGGD